MGAPRSRARGWRLPTDETPTVVLAYLRIKGGRRWLILMLHSIDHFNAPFFTTSISPTQKIVDMITVTPAAFARREAT